MLELLVFVCNLCVKDQFPGVIIQRFSCVLDFTEVGPLDVDEFPYLCDELAGPFDSHLLLM